MRTIVINNQKGGVGKTMLAVHLAWFLAEGGARVLFVDLDGQGNSSKVLGDERQGGFAADLFDDGKPLALSGEPGITLLARDHRIDGVDVKKVSGMMKRFAALGSLFEYCVFDTPPAWDARNFAAMAVSDYLLAPIELKAFALDGVAQLLRSMKAVEEKGRQGRKINLLGLLASRYNSHDASERDNLKAVLGRVGTSRMFPGVITVRGGYEQAMTSRKPVWSIKSSGAKVAGAEIRGVLTEVRKRVDGGVVQEVE
jgi:chromosome partitioning protein